MHRNQPGVERFDALLARYLDERIDHAIVAMRSGNPVVDCLALDLQPRFSCVDRECSWKWKGWEW